MVKSLTAFVLSFALIINISLLFKVSGAGNLECDVNDDGRVTVEDLAEVRMAMLDVKKISEKRLNAIKKVAEPYEALTEADLEKVSSELLSIIAYE